MSRRTPAPYSTYDSVQENPSVEGADCTSRMNICLFRVFSDSVGQVGHTHTSDDDSAMEEHAPRVRHELAPVHKHDWGLYSHRASTRATLLSTYLAKI